MKADERVHRMELHEQWDRAAWWALGLVVFAVAVWFGAKRIRDSGIAEGRSMERSAQVRKALADNWSVILEHQRLVDSTTAAVQRADSVALTDSIRSVTKRRHADSARARVVIVSDTTVSIDSAPPTPENPIIVGALRGADERHALDSLAIEIMRKQIGARDRDRDAMKVEIGDWIERDSLHVENEKALVKEIATTGKRKFWQGVKAGAVGTFVALGALAIIIH